MQDSLRQKCFSILADAVSEVVGRRNLTYVAVVQASKSSDAGKERLANSMFQQISVTSRKQIRSNAIEKAYAERARVRDASRQKQPEAVLADLSKLFGRPQLA